MFEIDIKMNINGGDVRKAIYLGASGFAMYKVIIALQDYWRQRKLWKKINEKRTEREKSIEIIKKQFETTSVCLETVSINSMPIINVYRQQ